MSKGRPITSERHGSFMFKKTILRKWEWMSGASFPIGKHLGFEIPTQWKPVANQIWRLDKNPRVGCNPHQVTISSFFSQLCIPFGTKNTFKLQNSTKSPCVLFRSCLRCSFSNTNSLGTNPPTYIYIYIYCKKIPLKILGLGSTQGFCSYKPGAGRACYKKIIFTILKTTKWVGPPSLQNWAWISTRHIIRNTISFLPPLKNRWSFCKDTSCWVFSIFLFSKRLFVAGTQFWQPS